MLSCKTGHAWWQRIGFIAVVAALVSPAPSKAAVPWASQLLPDNTWIFVSVPDATDLARRWQTTAVGRMSQDPQLRPLLDQLYGSAADWVASLKEYVGASLTDILSIPQGELAFAIVPVEVGGPPEGPPGFLLFVDTGSKVSTARGLMNKFWDLGVREGGKRSTQTISGTTLTIMAPPNDGARGQPDFAWFDKDGLVVAGIHSEVVKQVLLNWNNSQAKTLSTNPKFAKIWDRCRAIKTEQPQAFFFADPIAMWRALAEENLTFNFILMMATRLGIDGFQAIGGSVALDCGSLDEVAQLHVLLESPRGGVLEPIALDSGDNTPEPFIPGDVARYATVHWRFEASYKSIARLYDSFQGEGAFANQGFVSGITRATGVDFEKELLPSLDGRVTYATWFEPPITPTSGVHLFAFGLKDPGPMTRLIQNVVTKTAPNRFRRNGVSDKEFYESVASEEAVRRGAPQMCWGIVDKYLVITTRPSAYQKALATLQTPDESLAKSLDFKLVASKMSGRFGRNQPSGIIFNSPEQGFRFLYGLATGEGTRSGLRQGAQQSGFLRAIDSALDNHPLPPFAVLEHYLAPGGGCLIDDDSGLHYVGFTLRRN